MSKLSEEDSKLLSTMKESDSESSIRKQAAGILERHHSDSTLSEKDQVLGRNPSSERDIEILMKVARSVTPSPAEFIAIPGPFMVGPPKSDRLDALIRLSEPDEKSSLNSVYLRLLKDDDVGIQYAAIVALSTLGDRRAIPKIKSLLKALPRNHFDPEGPNEGLTIPVILEHGQGIRLAGALMKFKECDSVEDILDHEPLSLSWSDILGPCKDKAKPLLLEKLKSDSPVIRLQAKKAILNLYGADSLPQGSSR